MVKARFIRAISTHANDEKLLPGPVAEAIAVFPADQGPFVVGDQIEIEDFGGVTIGQVWTPGDPKISHPDLAHDAVDGEVVVLVFKPYKSDAGPGRR
jgi:hypothetical protein